jgi:hypothetical protein
MESASHVQRMVQGKLWWFSVKGGYYFVFAACRVIVLVVLLSTIIFGDYFLRIFIMCFDGWKVTPK